MISQVRDERRSEGDGEPFRGWMSEFNWLEGDLLRIIENYP